MIINKRVCNMCKLEFVHPTAVLGRWEEVNEIDEETDLCHRCLEKVEKFLKERDTPAFLKEKE